MLFLKRLLLILTLLSLPFQLGKHLWFSFSYVSGLPVDYLAPTLYLADIFLIITTLLFLFTFLKKKSFKKRILKFLKLLAKYWWLIGFLVLNIVLAKSPQVALFGWLKIAKVFLLSFLVFNQRVWVKKNLPKIIAFWLFVQAFLTFFQFLKQGALGGLGYYLGERSFSLLTPGIAKINFNSQIFLRAYGTFSHPNSLAGFILLSLFLYLSFQGFKKPFSKLVLLAGLTSLILSFSRTAWLVGLVVLLLPKSALQLSRQKVGKRLALSLFLGSLSALVFFAFPNPLALRERIILAQTSLKVFAKNPFLGVGWDNFLVVLPDFWPFVLESKITLQPVHNLFLLVLSQLGVVGLFFVYKGLKKVVGQKTLLWWLIILLTGLTDHYWLDLNQNLLLLGVVLGLSY